MHIIYSKNYEQIKHWLNILTSTYAEYPSKSLAKTILYYINRLINHEDVKHDSIKACEYISMVKYWSWQANINHPLVERAAD